jgi:GTP cyclohydrolase IA
MTQPSIIVKYFETLGGNTDHYDPETTTRVIKFSNELRAKRDYEKFTTFESNTDQMIIGNHLKLFSFCEHHLLPFFGEVAIGYIPDGRVFGLSKFQRLIDKLASKPTIQEKLTEEITGQVNAMLKPLGVGVVMRAIHTCVFARGVQSTQAEFTTSYMFGNFRDNLSTRQEFLSVVMSDGRSRL